MIVHARPPDPEGLAAYVRRLRDGGTLRQLAGEFLGSAEFTARVPTSAAAAEVRRNAAGRAGRTAELPPPAADMADDVAALVLSDAVRRRLPVLAALYPDGLKLSDAAGYRLWLAERPGGAERHAPPGDQPAVSFILPVTRVPPRHLAAAVASALAQPNGTAELVMVVRGRPSAATLRLVAGRSGVAILSAPPWCGAAALFNRGLARARGALAVELDADSLLDASAAATLAAAGAGADIVLADDDALDAQGLRHAPRFGAAWDPDRALASGWTGLVAMRPELARQAGGLRRAGPRGTAELLLRAAAAVQPGRIRHAPSVLLSRRSLGAPGAARARASRAVHPVPRTPPRVCVVIPTRDRADLLAACVSGLMDRTSYPEIELVVVDNGSAEPDAVRLLDRLAGDPRVSVLRRPGPFNWSALNNAGVASMRGDVAVLLNNDVEVIEPGWLREMVAQAVRPEVGAVGAKLLYPDGRVQHAGVTLGPAGRGTHVWRFSPGASRGYLGQLASVRQVSAVTGACLAIRRSVYEQAGGCDEALRVTWNDVDLCLRVRALGLRVIWTPHARLLHREQASRGSDDSPGRQERFLAERDLMRARWGDALDRDPFWSPDLRPGEGPDEIEPRIAVE